MRDEKTAAMLPSMVPRIRRLHGFVLILVAGVLTLSMLLGLSLLQAALIGRAVQSARTAESEARLAAGSGLEYAAARLVRNGYPGFDPSMRGRGDDWTYRQGSGVRVEGSENPSYSHGEPWSDTMSDGIRQGNEPSLYDLDGDGRFSAASGRLRGTGGARNLSFALAIESPEGKLPLNAGVLWAEDIFNPSNPGGIPDHKDLEISYHRGLAHALNNLGAILLPDTDDRRHWRADTGSHPDPAHVFEMSWLGHDLITYRPAGGYPDEATIRGALLPLGYTQDDLDTILPFLDVGPYDAGDEATRSTSENELRQSPASGEIPRYVPVSLAAAPTEVLESLWRYIGASTRLLEGEQTGWATPYEATPYERTGKGKTFEELDSIGNSPRATLFPDEAAALASRLIGLRKTAPLSWTRLFKDLHDGAKALFSADHANIPPAAPVLKQGWTQAKADLAFSVIAADRAMELPLAPATLAGWGYDRFPDADFPARPGCQQGHLIGNLSTFWIDSADDYPQAGWDYAGAGWASPFKAVGDLIGPQGGTVAPPVRFSVAALGGSGAARRLLAGTFRSAERVEFACQEDFENLSLGTNLARRGIIPEGDAQASAESRHDWAHQTDNSGYNGDNLGRNYARVTSTPQPNVRTVTSAAWGAPQWGFSRIQGALTLSKREGGLQEGALLYWAPKQDFDGVLNNNSIAPDYGPHGDFWHERDAVFFAPYEPALPLAPVTSNQPVGAPYGTEDGVEVEPCQIPGLEGAPPSPLDGMTIESRMAPGSRLVTKEIVLPLHDDQHVNLSLSRKISPVDPTMAVSQYTLRVRDSENDGSWWGPGQSVTCTIPDAALGGFNPFNQHVVLIVRGQANRTRFALVVNGKQRDWDGGIGPVFTYDQNPLTVTDQERIFLADCAEARFYATSLSNAQVKTLADTDRFVRQGIFTSPLYALDEPARMGLTQWTGFRPPKADGTLAGSIIVRVTGYEKTDGSGWFKTVTLPGSSGAVEELAALGLSAAVRSFRYTVEFDIPTADIPPPLCDSPVFESIWFTFARPGRVPRWETPR